MPARARYERKIAAAGALAALALAAAPPAARAIGLQLSDHAEAPITGDPRGTNTAGLLARINFMRDEPGRGSRRAFVNDGHGLLYVLDRRSGTFSTYLNLNGAKGGLFPRFVSDQSLASGFISFQFDPDYRRNGIFYTLHLEDARSTAAAAPRAGIHPGLDLTGYATTDAIATPSGGQPITREAVVVEWKDLDLGDALFAGVAREVLRVQLLNGIHPMGDIAFNPTARRGHPDWRMMYLSVGDSATGETADIRRLSPQRLDTFLGKILRIFPDPAGRGALSASGRYRIPDDNPFVAMRGARAEIWALGLRNPHRLAWDVDVSRSSPDLFAFVIGSNSGTPRFETVSIIRRGANHGYPLWEGSQAKPPHDVYGATPADGMLNVRISDTDVRSERIRVTHPVVRYPTSVDGDAIAGGFVYRGRLVPALRGKLVFGDITTGKLWYADSADVHAADDADPATMAPIHELQAGLRALVEARYRARGGMGETLPGKAPVAGRGRVDLRLAVDGDGELYLLTKSDGMIRKVVGAN